jgi:DNA-binding transcriptional LysR family regulator
MVACHKILEAHHEAAEALCGERNSMEGTLHVHTPMQFARSVLSTILPGFQAIYPKLKVEVALYCSQWDQEPVAAHDIFLKVRSPRDSRRHLRVFPAIRQGLFCSREFLSSCKEEPKHPADLTRLTCIGHGSSPTEAWMFSRASEQITIRPDFRIAVADPDILARLAVASAGITVLPSWLAEQQETGEHLVRLLPQWELEPIIFCALFNGRLRPESKEHAFLEHLKSVLGTREDPRCSGKDPKRFFVLQNDRTAERN